MPDRELLITLTLHHDGAYENGRGDYWFAMAGDDWDGDGATPLDAVMSLAQQMHKALNRMEENPNA